MVDKSQIQKNIETLDYLHGTGILSTRLRNLTADEVYVFIGAGGTGCTALANLKAKMKDNIDSQDMKRVAFLAVDTDHPDLSRRVDRGEFDNSEVLPVPFMGAHKAIDPTKITPNLKAWVHKDLWADTGGAGGAGAELIGKGAGAKRQCGRLLFMLGTTQKQLSNHLTNIKNQLVAGAGTVKIKIVFLVGIAGGTGSGTVIDLAFLTRHFWEKIVGHSIYERTEFSAYLFMPSASGDGTPIDANAERTSNRNAYAALKEIDHYMTLQKRGERYTVNYGGVAGQVNIPDNIFGFCTLVEGQGAGGVLFTNPADTARQVVADSIMNMICTQEMSEDNQGNQVFMVDSFLSNKDTQTDTAVNSQSDNIWPRDTNYIYSVLGYSSCIVPIDLITVYLMKKVFDKMYALFAKCGDVNDENTEKFIIACGLDTDELSNKWQTLNPKNVREDIQRQANICFKEHGPYFMINLTKKAIDINKDKEGDYLRRAKAEYDVAVAGLDGFSLFSSREKRMRKVKCWQTVQECYECATEYLLNLNNELYAAYNLVLIELQKLLNKNAKLITDTNEFHNTFGSSFCWSPVDLTPGSDVKNIVETYLGSMYNDDQINLIVDKFIQDLCDNKDKWTGCKKGDKGLFEWAKSDVAKNIREFVREELSKCVDLSIEDFVVKIYSENPTAKVFETDAKGKEVPTHETTMAANKIYTRLSQQSQALVEVDNTTFNLSQCYNNVYITIPANCEYLYGAIKSIAGDSKVLKSSTTDRIVWYKLYSGIPAWALTWTKQAEEDYETGDGPNSCGLHMSQGEGSEYENWAVLPNLYPEAIWSRDSVACRTRTREAGISKKIRDLMDTARDMNLVEKDTDNASIYDVWKLPDTNVSADELIAKAYLDEGTRYTLDDFIKLLKDSGMLKRKPVKFIGQVMSPGPGALLEEQALEDFRYNLAKRTLRRLVHLSADLETTVNKLKEIEQKLSERVVIDPKLFNKFIDCLKWDLICYDGDFHSWLLTIGDEKPFVELEHKIEQICAHYFAFVEFCSFDEDTMEEIDEAIKEKKNLAKEDKTKTLLKEANQQLAKIKASFEKLRYSKKSEMIWSEDSPFAVANNNAWPMRTELFKREVNTYGYDAEKIREFYTKLINNM